MMINHFHNSTDNNNSNNKKIIVFINGYIVTGLLYCSKEKSETHVFRTLFMLWESSCLRVLEVKRVQTGIICTATSHCCCWRWCRQEYWGCIHETIRAKFVRHSEAKWCILEITCWKLKLFWSTIKWHGVLSLDTPCIKAVITNTPIINNARSISCIIRGKHFSST